MGCVLLLVRLPLTTPAAAVCDALFHDFDSRLTIIYIIADVIASFFIIVILRYCDCSQAKSILETDWGIFSIVCELLLSAVPYYCTI